MIMLSESYTSSTLKSPHINVPSLDLASLHMRLDKQKPATGGITDNFATLSFFRSFISP